MAEEMNKNLPLGETEEEIEEIDVYTLTDENGNESQFELIGEATIEGVTYYALTELDENNNQIRSCAWRWKTAKKCSFPSTMTRNSTAWPTSLTISSPISTTTRKFYPI